MNYFFNYIASEFGKRFRPRRRNILIVEHDPVSLLILRRTAETIGVPTRISVARTQEMAEAHLESGEIDFVISDHQLEGAGNGYNLWLYCQWRYPNIPFLLTSGTRPASQPSGRPPFLAKPFLARDCRRMVEGMLE